MRVLFLLVCGIGTVNSVLAAAYLWAHRRGQTALNRLFALLLLTFSIRVGKAVWVFFFASVHPAFEIVWMAMLAAGGLLFTFYARRLGGAPSLRWLLTVVPAATVATVGVAYLAGANHAEWLMFLAVLAVDGAAIACAAPLVVAEWRRTPRRTTARWLAAITLFMSAAWLLYAVVPVVVRARWMGEDVLFDVEAVAFSLAVYGLVYAELRSGLVSKIHAPRPAPASAADEQLAKRLQQLVEGEKAYLDPSLSVQSLARTLHASPQQVSRVVNTQLGAGFNDYVNRLRIEEAVRILATPEGAARKIGSLADDCGFSSSSVFYAAFRKFTGRTPSEHLKERQIESSGS